MISGPHYNLVYARKFAWAALDSLFVPNQDRRTRIINGISNLLLAPQQGMPAPILNRISEIRTAFLQDGGDRYGSEGLVAYNVRKTRSWRKREKIIEDLVWVSVGIIEAGSLYLGSSDWLSSNDLTREI